VSDRYPNLCRPPAHLLGRTVVLDGGIVAFDASLEIEHSPFVDRVERQLRWVEPLVAVNVTYAEATLAGTLRQPVLVGIAPVATGTEVAVTDDLAARLRGRTRVSLAAGQRL